MENKKISTDKELGWRSLSLSLSGTQTPPSLDSAKEGRKDGWIILLITKVDVSQTEKREEQLRMLNG